MTGKTVSLGDFQDAPALLVMVICNHCPFVKHIRQGLIQFARDYQAKGLAIVAISANDAANYPDDSPAKIAEEAKTFGYPFPYLHDESQAVAKAYHAACTPDFFLFDAGRKLVYRGQFDGSRPGNKLPVTGSDLRRRRMRCWPVGRFRPRSSPASAATSNGKPATSRTIRAEKSSFVGGGHDSTLNVVDQVDAIAERAAVGFEHQSSSQPVLDIDRVDGIDQTDPVSDI
jgi:thiol-disulfide isomerase/thioredoxin